MGFCTRGTTSGSSLPVAVSKMRSVPCSEPLSDSETATWRPSCDGSYQSIAVVPFSLRWLGSTTTRSDSSCSGPSSTTSIGWFFGGCRFSAKSFPPAWRKALRVTGAWPISCFSASRIASRAGSASR